jgi:outer membrane immunogenic protein
MCCREFCIVFKRILTISVLLSLSAPALAADLAVKARPLSPLSPVPVSTWTGFYAGANLGYGWRNDEGSTSSVSGPGFVLSPVGTPLYGGARAFSSDADGVIGGLQIGYNWQVSPMFVVGVEADWQASDLSGGANCIIPCGVPIAPIPGPGGIFFPSVFNSLTAESSIDWFGTARVRGGALVGNSLFYVTGGLAWGDVSVNASSTGNGTLFGLFNISTWNGAVDHSDTKFGWTLGAGVEAKLNPNWSVKAEYLYIDLGDVTASFPTVSTGAATGVTATRTVSTDITAQIVRLGLNYKFNGWLLP